MNTKLYNLHLFIVPALLLFAQPGTADESPTLKLAIELAEDQLPEESAVEFRRLALNAKEDEHEAAYRWLAAYQYIDTELHSTAEAELDRMESASSVYSAEASLIRSQIAEKKYDFDTAVFFLDSIGSDQVSEPMKDYIEKSKASLLLKSGNIENALLFTESGDLKSILNDYHTGPKKKPWLGGLLGVIPGLGYAYSGEYANAVRSIILNSIFIYGMVDTAGDEEWGAFGVITFFEITWYTGSIYGGIDAAQRFNEERRDEAIQAIKGNASFAPDYPSLPILNLNFNF